MPCDKATPLSVWVHTTHLQFPPPTNPFSVMSLTPPPLASVFQEFVRKYQSTLEQTAGSGRSILPKPSPPSPHGSTAWGSPHKDPPLQASSHQDDVFNSEGFVQSLFPAPSRSSTNGNGSHCASTLGRAVSGAEAHTSIPEGEDVALTSSLIADKLLPATALSSSTAMTSSSTAAGKISPKQR